MIYLKGIVFAALFFVAYAIVDFVAGVTAPVLGPIVLVGAIGALFRIVWKLSR